VQPEDRIVRAVGRAADDDRRVGAFPQLGTKEEAVDIWQNQVEDDEVGRPIRLEQSPRRRRVRRAHHLIVVVGKH
jgi:hypothetical protein